MTFKEAQLFIQSNWSLLSPQLVDSEPPHMVLETIIAPINTRLDTLATIYEKMIDEHISNEDILFEMGLSFTDVAIFVTLKMKGYIFFMPFNSYQSSSLVKGSDS